MDISKNNSAQSVARIKLIALIFILIMTAVSVGLRYSEVQSNKGAPNIEASYHVLFTVNAFFSESFDKHLFLPTTTFGGDLNKFIPLGVNVATENGDFIYTSFPSPGFLAPYLFFKSFGLEPSILNLAYFNFLLGVLCSLSLFFLLIELLSFAGVNERQSIYGAVFGCLIGIFSYEALLSHGIVYWAHSLYQLVFILTLLFLASHFRKYNTAAYSKPLTAVLLLSFLGPAIEWTGYIFNIGAIIIFAFNRKNGDVYKKLWVGILVATFFAGVFTISHFGFLIGFEELVKTLYMRYEARSGAYGSASGLLAGYTLSYGFFFLTLIVGLVFTTLEKREDVKVTSVFKIILFLAAFPLIENFIMLQHATQFSFDRLKLLVPMAMLLGLAFCYASAAKRALLIVMLTVSAAHSYASYTSSRDRLIDWNKIDKENQSIATKVAENIDNDCTVFATNIPFRGYAANLFKRNMYEGKRVQDLRNLMQGRSACAGVFLSGQNVLIDMPKFEKAIIVSIDGNVMTIRP